MKHSFGLCNKHHFFTILIEILLGEINAFELVDICYNLSVVVVSQNKAYEKIGLNGQILASLNLSKDVACNPLSTTGCDTVIVPLETVQIILR